MGKDIRKNLQRLRRYIIDKCPNKSDLKITVKTRLLLAMWNRLSLTILNQKYF